MNINKINELDFTGQTDSRINVRFYKTAFMKYFRAGGFARYMDKNPIDVDACEQARVRWVTIAGSHYSSVDVVDDSGNVLIKIPPLLERLAVIDKPEPVITAVNTLEKFTRPTSDSDASILLSGVDQKIERNEEQVIADWMAVIGFDPDTVPAHNTVDSGIVTQDTDLHDSYEDSDLYE